MRPREGRRKDWEGFYPVCHDREGNKEITYHYITITLLALDYWSHINVNGLLMYIIRNVVREDNLCVCKQGSECISGSTYKTKFLSCHA